LNKVRPGFYQEMGQLFITNTLARICKPTCGFSDSAMKKIKYRANPCLWSWARKNPTHAGPRQHDTNKIGRKP